MTVSGNATARCIILVDAPSGSDDIKDVDLSKVHNLSGPVAIEGAEPGDCLVVDILDGTPVCTAVGRNFLTRTNSDAVREDAVGIYRS